MRFTLEVVALAGVVIALFASALFWFDDNEPVLAFGCGACAVLAVVAFCALTGTQVISA